MAEERLIDGTFCRKTVFAIADFYCSATISLKTALFKVPYKVLIGYDSIEFLQSFEMVLYLYKLEKTKNSFNEFVKASLKSELAYHQKSQDEQIEILSTYWDYLDRLSHEEDRVIAFVLYIFLQHAQEYINRFAFLFYSKKNINALFSKAKKLSEQYESIIPDTDFFQQSVNGGIQKIIKDDI